MKKVRTPRRVLIGLKFGRLLVLQKPTGKGRIYECQCDCGKVVLVESGRLVSNNTRSCGCYQADTRGLHSVKHGASRGYEKTPEYRAWRAMKSRCYNPRVHNFSSYGGRGIRVSPLWINDFSAFLSEVGPRPSPKHSLDRKECNKNYEPGNVRWADIPTQANNKRESRRLNAWGVSAPISTWAAWSGLKYMTIYARIAKGVSPERAVLPVSMHPVQGIEVRQ